MTAFVPGNHENYTLLSGCPVVEWQGAPARQLRPNVFELLRGEVYTIERHSFFCFGGLPPTIWMWTCWIPKEPAYAKGDYESTARIAEHYPTAVKNAEKTLHNLLSDGLPGLEDTPLKTREATRNYSAVLKK